MTSYDPNGEGDPALRFSPVNRLATGEYRPRATSTKASILFIYIYIIYIGMYKILVG